MKNEQKTLDKHTAKFIAMVCENLPKMSGEVMDKWIRDPKALQKVLREALCPPENVQVILDFWLYLYEEQKITTFYQECFGIKVDWSKITIPENKENFKCLELILVQLTEDQIFEVHAERFGKDKVYKSYESISQAVDRTKGGEVLRPKTDYALLHHDGAEPDQEHLNKSYDDFCNDGNKYMIVKEGMIAAMRYRFETGKMYDSKGLTRFHTLDSDGNAIYMCIRDFGWFSIDGYNRSCRNPVRGPRQCDF